MPRRKNAYLSDGSSSGSDSGGGGGGDGSDGYNSQEDADSRAERALFEYNGKKRRRMGRGGGGKAAAWEGVFGAGDDEGTHRGLSAGRGGRGKAGGGRTDWTRAPAFVSKKAEIIDDAAEANMSRQPGRAEEAQGAEDAGDESEDAGSASGDEDDGGESEEEESGDDDDEEDEPSRKASPRIRDEEEEDDDARPAFGRAGLGGTRAPPPGDGTSSSAAADPAPKASTGGRGGIGSATRGGRGGIGSSSRAGLGFPPPSNLSSASPSGTSTPRGGIGSSSAPTMPEDLTASSSAVSASGMPRAFGRSAVGETASREDTNGGPSRTQRSFVPRSSTPTPARPTELTSHEAAHFRTIESSYGARLLANLGWAPGKGLGVNEDGRAVPVTAGKVLKGQGITKGVRTEDSKREARRRGEIISDDEDEGRRGRGRRGGNHAQGQRQGRGGGERKEGEQSWKKQRKVKVKVEHKTYEQILAEASDATSAGVGVVIDARGGEMKEVASLASLSLSNWTPTSDNMQLPELRHNLRLVLDVTKADVDALAREGKSVLERRKWAVREEQLAQKRSAEAAEKIRRLERIQECARAIADLSAKAAMSPQPTLAGLNDSFETVLGFKAEYKEIGLDELIVGSIAQVMRAPFAQWDPFDPSDDLIKELKPWRKAFNLPQDNPDESRAVVKNGNSQSQNGLGAGSVPERSMTSWESLLWSLWLPKVRSKINNDWSPTSPHPAVHLLETWSLLLPPFISDNILDQLILPKVKSAVEEWSPRPSSRTGKVRSLAGIVFPWLPLLGPRLEEVLELAKRRIRLVLRNWVAKDGVPPELEKWRKDIYSSSEWDKLILQFVLPKLGVTLRSDFIINPADQDMLPLEGWVIPWHKLMRESMFVQLLDGELWPKWLEVLWVWLASPGCKADEVANWFIWWKSRFPPAVVEMRGVANAFNQGLELMNDAMRLGSLAPAQLRKPIYTPLPASSKIKSTSTSSRTLKSTHATSASRPSSSAGSPAPTARPPPASAPNPALDPAEITFRTIVEDLVTAHDLILLPLGRSHADTGKPLMKVARGVDGRGGVTMYIGDNAVFVQEGEGWRAVTLEEMVRRASGGK